MPFSELLSKHGNPLLRDKLVFGPAIDPDDYYAYIYEKLRSSEFYSELLKFYPSIPAVPASAISKNVQRNNAVVNNSSKVAVNPEAYEAEEKIYMKLVHTVLGSTSDLKRQAVQRAERQAKQAAQRAEKKNVLKRADRAGVQLEECGPYYCRLTEKSFREMCADKSIKDFLLLDECNDDDTPNDWIITLCCENYARKDSFDAAIEHDKRCPICRKPLGK